MNTNYNSEYRPTMLVIMDGYGLGEEKKYNAVLKGSTPNLDKLFKEYPMTRLKASGEAVGLPEGQMGNSEVGHLNIGAGRTVYQDLSRITKSIDDGSFYENPQLLRTIKNAKDNNKALHIMGLVSDGGVHSHNTHLYAILKLAKLHNLKKVYINAFLDGRDTPPRSASKYLKELEEKTKEICGEIVLISGRYYAMDRDNRWERIEEAYDAMTSGIGRSANSVKDAITQAYDADENDEFVKPTIIKNIPVSDGDSVIFFNFRPDRAREIVRSFVDAGFNGFQRKKTLTDLCFVCMTEYDTTMPNVSVAYPPETIQNTLGEYIAALGLSQLRIAETEKYAHVTFFFNGGVEVPNKNEDRILIPSPKVPTYDLKPDMSAYEVTDTVLENIDSQKYDLIILNYANDDMVGHTGIMDAAVKAVETVDTCVGKVVDKILQVGGQILITADHGNAEIMANDQGNPVTAHSTNPVPLIFVRKNPIGLKSGGALSDIAPTLLDMMGIKKPVEMTGNSLLDK